MWRDIPRYAWVFLLLMVSACGGGGNVVESTPVPLQAPPEQSQETVVITGALQNALNGSKIRRETDENGKVLRNNGWVWVSGADADKVVDGTGQSLFDSSRKQAGPIPATEGHFVFYLRAADPGHPLRVHVLAEADGYLSAGTEVEIDPVLPRPVLLPSVFRLIPCDMNEEQRAGAQKPSSGPGVDLVRRTVVVIAGKGTGEDIALLTDPVALPFDMDADGNISPEEKNSFGHAELFIPKGTVFSRDGEEMLGELTITLAYQNPVTPRSLASAPATLQTGGASFPTALISLGLVRLDITDHRGGHAEFLSGPAKVVLRIPQGVSNANAAPQSSDPVPLYRFEERNGDWQEEGVALFGDADANNVADGPEAGKDPLGNWFVGFQTRRAGAFSPAWDGAEVGTTEFHLQKGSTLENLGGVELHLRRRAGGWAKTILYAGKAETLQVSGVPGGEEMDVTPLYQGDAPWGENIGLGPVSSGVTLTLDNLGFSPQAMEIQAVEACLQDRTIETAVPSVVVWATKAGSSLPFATAAVTDANGKAFLYGMGGDGGGTYTLWAANRRTGVVAQGAWDLAANGNRVKVFFGYECDVITPPTGATGGSGDMN